MTFGIATSDRHTQSTHTNMATRGVKQLARLQVFYCEHGGSSSGIREYISSKRIIDFAASNPKINIEVKVRNGKHPFIKGGYITGFDKQICVKNLDIPSIQKFVYMLKNSSGRKIKNLSNKPVKTDTPSVQGVWTPALDIVNKHFDVKIT